MSSDTCRLCLSKNNLISLFSGKSRNIRNFLRKMIQETIQIKIEYDDCNSSICFNCCSDISNFYFFKLNCLQNDNPYKETDRFVKKIKKAKLDHLDLKEMRPPNLESTEIVINWLNAKKNSLVDGVCNIAGDTQPVPLLCDISTQSDIIEMVHNECQTIRPMFTSSETQCNEIDPCSTPKKHFKTCSSQTQTISNDTKLLKCTNCLKQNSKTLKKKTKNVYSQTTNTSFVINNEDTSSSLELTNNTKKNTQESCCQTDSNSFINTYVQTEPKKLSQKLYSTSLPSERNTNDVFSQTTFKKLSNKFAQCNILNLNGCNTQKWQMKKKNKANLKTNENDRQIADPQTFNDALINGFDNTFVSKTTQTEFNDQLEKYDINQSDSKNSYLLSPKTNSCLKSITSKPIILSPEDIKQEKELFLESLSISTCTTPKKFLLSPKSAELLQINCTKADHVKICKLCDKALYNRKEAILHNKTHMQCNICRKKFRSLKATQNHIEECKVNQANILPFVDLVKVEQILEIRETYSKAFEQVTVI